MLKVSTFSASLQDPINFHGFFLLELFTTYKDVNRKQMSSIFKLSQRVSDRDEEIDLVNPFFIR